MMCTQAIPGLESTEHLHFLQPPMAWGMPSWGQGCPQAIPNTHRALGWPKPINFNFLGQKMAIWPMAKNGKLATCATLCGPLASCGPHPNGPKCANGHQGGQGPTLCSPHGHPQIWPPHFQIWGVPHPHYKNAFPTTMLHCVG